METIFRFTLVRPAFPADNPIRVQVERSSAFQDDLIHARGAENARTQMMAIAGSYAGTLGIARDYGVYGFGTAWSGLEQILLAGTPPTLGQIKTNIATLFGAAPNVLVNDAKFLADDVLAADGSIAVRMLTAEQPQGYGATTTVLRLAELIRAIARNAPGIVPAQILGWVITMPPKIFPLPNPLRSAVPSPASNPTAATVLLLAGRIAASKTALDELMGLEATLSTVEDAFHPPPAVSGHSAATDLIAAPPPSIVSQPAPPAATRTANSFTLSSQAVKGLSSGTLALLKTRGIDPAAVSLDRMTNAIGRGLNTDVRQLAQVQSFAPLHIRVIGNKLIAVPMSPQPINGGPSDGSGSGGNGGGGNGGSAALTADPPTSFGTISSVGVADLLVVKQQLKRYDPVDVGHIENVLKGESMDRAHVNSTVTQQFTLNQTDTTTTTEQDLESSDRFEMSRNVNDTISQTASLTAGMTISGSYGPTVSFSANVQGSAQTSQQTATQQSTTYGRDVTTRTAKTVSERVLQQQSLQITTTVSDTVNHKIDNTSGSGNLVGVYQWVDKIYEAQVFNYGKRALFDFSVPEPAALAIAAMKSRFANATELRKPADFGVTAAMIDETNYPAYALEWEATGINPPPDSFVSVAKTFHNGPDDGSSPTKGCFDDSTELALPDGYQAVFATASSLMTTWESDAAIDLAIGAAVHRFESNSPWTWNVAMAGEVSQLAIALKTFRTCTYSITLDVKCQRTPRAMDKWRNETYNTLLQAYQSQRANYEDKLAALQAQAGVEISGRNPDENRQIERTELKRSCIGIITAQNFEVFGSLVPGADGLPNIDFTKAGLEAPYIRFFEQAFEWENIQYVFYPYYWGKRDTWLERFNYDDVDPLFAQFLQAGEARVVVPVRPGYELAIDYFLATGQIWNGEGLPAIGSGLFVSIIDEVREAEGAPGAEVPQGDPWEVRIATNLVILRDDGQLPSWTKQPDGSWKPN